MKKKPHVIKLQHGERIIAVVPEYCSGPGWRNSPIWVYIGTNDGRLKTECIQPEDQTVEQMHLFRVCESAHLAMLSSVPVAKARNTS